MARLAHIRRESEILIVDDQLTMRKIISSCLREFGYCTIREAKDGEAARKMLDEFSIELIISDWHMPKVSGMELLRYVRSQERFSSIPFVMLTGEVSRESVRSAIEAGACHYISKPFSALTIETELAKVVQRQVSMPVKNSPKDGSVA